MECNASTPEVTAATAAGGRAAGTAAACRWNPTKEQINMLENLYGQGIRTPTAEQIQEITSRLQVYGNIEGKNVFYWFQNHKARERQKQKQNYLSFFHQYYHHHHCPPPPNVLCGPFYAQQSDLGFYDQYPKVQLSSSSSNIRRSQRSTKPRSPDGAGFLSTLGSQTINTHAAENNMIVKQKDEKVKDYNHLQTLQLFPLHPTGILQEKEVTTSNVTSSPASTACTSSSSHCTGDQLYFDFFSGNSHI